MAVADRLAEDLRTLEEACGLLDRSERGKLALTGEDAKAFLAGQVTNDVVGLEPGSGLYAAVLTHKGKMLGDLRVLDAGSELLLDTERVALQAIFDVLRRTRIGHAVELHKRTLQRGLLSLVGPAARAVAGAPDLPEREHAHREGEIGGRPVRLIATDVGVDVLCLAEDTATVREALEAAGARPVGEPAAEALRIARGRPRYGVELDEGVIPQEAGLNERAVSFTKGCYTGQETVARLFYKGKPNRHLRGLRLSAPAEPGTSLRLGDREVGRLGGTALHPRLGPVALALVRREAAPGDQLVLGDGPATATVAELPLEPPGDGVGHGAGAGAGRT
jgi:folate-binding protein YgfZ